MAGPKYPSNLNGPSLTVDNISQRWELKDTTGGNSAGHLPTSYPTAGTGNLSNGTQVLGDMYRALSILQVEKTALDKLLVHYCLPVKAASTAALANTPTYNKGTAGVGATLTAGSNTAFPAQDGVSLAAGDRVLVKDQATGFQNGVYVLTTLGDGSNPWVLTRAADADQATVTEMSAGLTVVVEGGTTNGGKAFICTNETFIAMDSAVTAGTGNTAITFAELVTEAQLPIGNEVYILPVAAASTTNLGGTPTYSNGTAGVGATITADANGAFPTTDGVVAALGNRYLLKDQTDPAQNGVYRLTTLGSGGAAFVLTRAADADEAADWLNGLAVKVEGGTVAAGLTYKSDVTTVTMGTTGITFTAYTASTATEQPFDNAMWATREQKYAVQSYSFKMYPIIEESMRLAYKINRLRTDIALLSGTLGDGVPAAGRYPSGRNRGY